jgi:hypothetical protein
MADPFSPDAFYGSAGEFALSALEPTTPVITAGFRSTPEQPWSTWQRHVWPGGRLHCWPS